MQKFAEETIHEKREISRQLFKIIITVAAFAWMEDQTSGLFSWTVGLFTLLDSVTLVI